MIKKLRLATGLVLFVYVATHFANHALGLISLATAEGGRDVFLFVWRNWPMTVVLYGALAIHIALALWAIYARRTLRQMAPWEATQLVLGLLIPIALVEHVIGTRAVHELHGTQDRYVYVVLALWVWQPTNGLFQTAMLLIAWVHGCIGLHYWLRLKPWHRRWAPWLLVLAVVAPLLALAGFNQMGHDVADLAKNREALQAVVAELRLPTPEQARALYDIINLFHAVFVGLVLAAFLARILRKGLERRRGLVRLRYPAGREITVTPGVSVLEASREAGIAHASVCGGRGRCSTCRVRLGRGAEALPPPLPDEKRVLDRVGAPPNVRLACQIRPTADLEVTPLLPPNASPRDAQRKQEGAAGRDKVIAILFADLRQFTQFAEKRLPYDVVFVLNRYFTAMGQAIQDAGGYLDKFIGDGVMALFGTAQDERAACRAALEAARNMALRLAELNETLKHDLPAPLRIGIGIHAGHAIIGEMGFGRTVSLTAIGDSVNTASRLESMTKEFGAQLVVSQAVLDYAGMNGDAYARQDVEIRGRDEKLSVFVVKEAAGLALPPAGAKAATP